MWRAHRWSVNRDRRRCDVIGGRWWALVGAGGRATPPLTPEKDGTSHQICSNGRIGSDLV
ncbi:hypothetical protein BT094_11025 [Corynebacterium diphtheriae]|nr:hypothetical protein BT094_11025 [Corynebacterium diphtheriae]